jgi:COP9 signalosome complex subunit 3
LTEDQPIIAIRLIRTAILRLDPTSSTLTTNHVIFLRHCLEAKCFRDALPIIDRDILEFAPHSRPQNVLISTLSLPSSSYIYIQSGLTEKLTYRSHLEYHLFAALIYIGLKNWERALQFLTFVIAAPTVGSASTIQVEAYKKWVIVGLIHRGEVSFYS